MAKDSEGSTHADAAWQSNCTYERTVSRVVIQEQNFLEQMLWSSLQHGLHCVKDVENLLRIVKADHHRNFGELFAVINLLRASSSAKENRVS